MQPHARPAVDHPAIERLLVALAFVAASGEAARATALEPWADPDLPVRDAMVLWLDAAAQPAARAALGLPALRDMAALDAWLDGSGEARHCVERRREARPLFRRTPAGDLVRFDGEDDALGLSVGRIRLAAFSLVVVAAPRANPGDYRALVSAGAAGQNDYVSGFNLDLGSLATRSLSCLNVEGPGFGGERNLARSASPFAAFVTLAVVATQENGPNAPGEVRLSVAGAPQGNRPRAPGVITIDSLAIGARSFSHTADPPFLRGFFPGDIAEVILFARALDDRERLDVERYLERKHARLFALRGADAAGAAVAADAAPLTVVRPGGPSGPPVEALLPGFGVRSLPVELTNVNNVRYRNDGRLVALAYDGRILLLEDQDGDGLEESVATFWEGGGLRAPIGMALAPAGFGRPAGVYVTSKGKVSFFGDADGDDRADAEQVVATGWEELSHGVDALGVAVARDGSVYFSLGCADFTNPYLADGASGAARYSLSSERGTVQRVAADWSARETVATGVRFLVALELNGRGDLFATDQEGATWLEGGNPLDELLEIRRGRHYGFPPRHDRHLADVFDEPSVHEYGPQHQSTCGLCFNDPRPDGLQFGPPSWKTDAFVSGYSRGKLYRTQLVKTPSGYLARGSILAAFGMLVVDQTLSPRGDLVVACHGGGPDWGSGPAGTGALFQLRSVDPLTPQPVAVWCAGPIEVRVAFDRMLPPSLPAEFAGEVEIVYGPAVRPGDHFEVLRPGYRVVEEQLATPRRRLEVLHAAVAPGRRTLVLRTSAHSEPSRYSVRMPSFTALSPAASRFYEIDYALDGVEAAWDGDPAGAGGVSRWQGWLPHPDLGASLELFDGSEEANELALRLALPGRLTLRTQVSPPPDVAEIRVDATSAVEIELGDTHWRGSGEAHIAWLGTSRADLEVEVETGIDGRPPELRLAYATPRSSGVRPLGTERFVLPWAGAAVVASVPPPRRAAPQGSWLRGRAVFLGDEGEARCASCHRVRGEGSSFGPDLSNLVHREAGSVLRDIAEPSAVIHPDHINYTVTVADGRILSGILRADGGDKVRVLDSLGQVTELWSRDVVAYHASPVSVMPEGLDRAIGPARLQDLLTFLLTPAPLMPEEFAATHPPRSAAAFRALLEPAEAGRGSGRQLDILLVAGPKDHGPGEHDYPAWQDAWARLLRMADGVRVSTAWSWPDAGALLRADVVVCYFWNHAWSADKGAALDAFLARGGGIVLLHSAVIAERDAPELARRVGPVWETNVTKFRHGPLDLQFHHESGHPVVRGLTRAQFHDESYWPLRGPLDGTVVLASAVEEGEPRPLVWTRELGRGRVFCSVLGHYSSTFNDPLFRLFILRGISWAAHEPAARLEMLAAVGAAFATGG